MTTSVINSRISGIDIKINSRINGTVRDITEHELARPLCAAGLRIRRSWPRSADHLLLELVDTDGARIAGQWFADPDLARRIARETAGARLHGSVVLQPDGADRRLAGLPALVRAGHRLVGHRPERRAVVATPDGFTKIVPPAKLTSAAAAARRAARLPGIGAPAVLNSDADAGTLTTAALPGRPLTTLLGTDRAAPACARVGSLLADLHALPPTTIEASAIAADGTERLAEHGPPQEQAVLQRWQQRAADYGLIDRTMINEAEPTHQTPADSGRRVLLHRDFHDGQILIDGDRIGVLDFDLMAIGDPALDLANLLAQLELRAAQGVLADLDQAQQATLAGYRPDSAVLAALPGYLALARARLLAVYAFRDPELTS